MALDTEGAEVRRINSLHFSSSIFTVVRIFSFSIREYYYYKISIVLGLIDVKAGDAGSVLTHKQRSKLRTG
jgi:hypothetical protein